jgi:3-oxoacyl-[acyl-carrier protein] reductase
VGHHRQQHRARVRPFEPVDRETWLAYGEEGQRALVDRIALKRLGAPEDIASGVLFFASEHAGWITGQVLSIDGGK